MDKQKKQISEQNCADCIHAEVCVGSVFYDGLTMYTRT